MLVADSIFIASFMMVIVFMGLVALYCCVRLFSLLLARIEQSRVANSGNDTKQ